MPMSTLYDQHPLTRKRRTAQTYADDPQQANGDYNLTSGIVGPDGRIMPVTDSEPPMDAVSSYSARDGAPVSPMPAPTMMPPQRASQPPIQALHGTQNEVADGLPPGNPLNAIPGEPYNLRDMDAEYQQKYYNQGKKYGYGDENRMNSDLFAYLSEKVPYETNLSNLEYYLRKPTQKQQDEMFDNERLNHMLGGLGEMSAKMGNVRGEYRQSDLPQYFAGLNKIERDQMALNQNVSDAALARRNQGYDQMIKLSGIRKQEATEQQLNDPNSDISKLWRQTIREFSKSSNRPVDVPDTVTAAQILSSKYGSMFGEVLRTDLTQAGAMNRTIADNQSSKEIEWLRGQQKDKDRAHEIEIQKLRDIMKKYGIDADVEIEGNKIKAGKGKDERKEALEDRKTEMSMASSYRALPAVKAASEMRILSKELTELAKDNSGASDQAFTTKWSKILDPGSVVRETEFAMSAKNAGLMSQLSNYFERAKSGSLLTKEQRQNMLRSVNVLVKAVQEEEARFKTQFTNDALAYGLDPVRIVGGASAPNKTKVIRFNKSGASQPTAPTPQATPTKPKVMRFGGQK